MPTFKGETCNADLTGESIIVWQQAGTTGPLATILGQGFINGTKDSINALNEAGGICGAELALEFRDTAYDAEQEITAYQEGVEAGASFVLTYGSPASAALAPMTIESGVANIAAGLSAEAFYGLGEEGRTVGVAPVYSDQFGGFLDFLVANWDDIKPEGAGDDIVVGVIGWQGPFGAGATTPEALAYAEELGVTVLPLEAVAVDPAYDVLPNIVSLVSQGANVIYNQSLSFTPARVILTVAGAEAAGAIPDILVGGVNWSMNTDVLAIVASQAEGSYAAAAGYYGVFPYLWWNDVDEPGVQAGLTAFEAGGYPETDRAVGYLLSYAGTDAVAQILFHAIQTDGFENLNGDTFWNAFLDLGEVSAAGLFTYQLAEGVRAPNQAQIRVIEVDADGNPSFVVVQDFAELPDLKPVPAE
jgi:branched-chain amino acid transport system substrate-binding protein